MECWPVSRSTYLDMLKFKEIFVHKCFLDLLICPCDKQFVVMIGLCGKTNKNISSTMQTYEKVLP